jgi:ankyrin repeat protein
VIVRLCARFDVERMETSQATASVVDALLDPTTSARARKNNALRLAAAHDSLAPLALRLIAGGAEVDAARPSDGTRRVMYTPLCIACIYGNVVMVARLIAAGSRVDNATTGGVTPSFVAARHCRLDVLKMLIAAGADVNKASANGCTPLHMAAQEGHAGVVSEIIKKKTAGVDLNAALRGGESAGVTPLFHAAQNNRLDVVTLLISAGADVNKARFDDGCTPLHKAAQHGHAGVVSVLIETAGVDLNAAMTGDDSAGVTPLLLAAQNNRFDVVTLLIAAGADVNKAGADGCTPLHRAAQEGHAGVVSEIIETVGVDLNAALTDDESAGVTPLFFAAQGNRLDVVTLLIAAGANVSSIALASGCTPLHAAAQMGHADVVDPLIAAGANVNAICADGATALSIALRRGHAEVVQKLRAAGAN